MEFRGPSKVFFGPVAGAEFDLNSRENSGAAPSRALAVAAARGGGGLPRGAKEAIIRASCGIEYVGRFGGQTLAEAIIHWERNWNA